jgi:hypothetical protein
MASVYVSNLIINSGATFSQDFFLANSATDVALDLNNSIVQSQMRKWSGSVGVTTFTVNVVNASNGQIRIGLAKSDTSSLKPGRYVYDVLLTNNSTNVSSRVIEGSVLVREGVTR